MLRLRQARYLQKGLSKLFGKRDKENVNEVFTFLQRHQEASTTQRGDKVSAETPAATQGLVNPPSDAEVRWWLQVCVEGYHVRALYDPGASRTVMGPIGLQLASACGRALTSSLGRGARVADGRSSPISGYVELPFEVAGITKDLKVAVMPELDADCYLGVNFIREFQAVLDPCSNQLLIKSAGRMLELELASVAEPGVTALSALGLADVTEEERQRLQELLDSKLGAEPAALGCTDWIVHEIDVGNARPIKQRCYPYSPKVEEDLYAQVREMLDSGVIEPSSSGWSSPVVMVRKANGKYRFCIDFRKVNAVSKADA